MPFARLSYTKALGWWNGSVKRIVWESEREMLIGPMPPAVALLEHAGLGIRCVDTGFFYGLLRSLADRTTRGHVKKYLGRICTKQGGESGNVLLLVPSESANIEKSDQESLSCDLEEKSCR